MLKEKIEQILNRQVEREAYSANLYLAMAIWAETNGFEGISKWLYAQAEEEKLHMLKFIGYINERGGRAVMPEVKKPPFEFESVRNLFKEVLKHEEFVSESINEIAGVCMEQRDFSTQNWVQWFITEQIEEEASVRLIIDKLSLMGESKEHLYQFDKDIMSLRTPPTATATA